MKIKLSIKIKPTEENIESINIFLKKGIEKGKNILKLKKQLNSLYTQTLNDNEKII